MDRFTDGNALAGLLEELFVAEVTTAPRTCQSCGEEHAIGEHRLFTAAGYVLRCPACSDVAAAITVLPDRYVLALHGTWSLSREA